MYFTPYRNLEKSLAFEASSGLGYPLEVEFNQRNHSITFTTTIDKWNSNVDHIKGVIEKRNPEIEKGNQELNNQIPGLIEARKKKISAFEKELEEAAQQIDIPLKRLDIDEVPLVNLQVRKTIQALQRPLTQPRKEFVLDRKYALDILEIMERSGMQFELNPEVYGVKLGEEDLRSLMLAHLNTVFEGSATGETFSKGKVDIYLNIPKGQIFIAECKFWDGEKNYQDTIDQLFGYLTWRRNFAALITFSKNKVFTNVLSKVEKATTSHPTFSRDFQRLGKTHFQSTHTFPEDPKKEIEIHHLVFNLYVSK